MKPLACRGRDVGLAVVLALGLSGCGNTPTEITPLPRAIGEVQGVLLSVQSLRPLDPATQGVYHLWSLQERNRAQPLNAFYIDDGGSIVDESGAPIAIFTSENFAIRKTLALLVTVELPGPSPESPAGTQILSGTFIDGVAALSVPVSTNVFNASGSLRVFTPTDGPNTNEASGFWAVDAAGAPSLNLPDTTAALVFETFVEIGGRTLPVGRYERADQKDDANQYSSTLFPAPERPGEDFLLNAPEGLVFPTNLSGARITISLEGRVNDFVSRSQLIVLEAVLPAGLVGGEVVPFVNRAADNFPSGKAVLY